MTEKLSENPLKNIDINAIFSSNLLWLFFSVVIIIFTIISMVLVYHWVRYMIKLKTLKIVLAIYFIGAAIFITSMALSIIFYTKL